VYLVLVFGMPVSVRLFPTVTFAALASEGIVSFGVCVPVCVSAALRVVLARRVVAARHNSLGGEGNALYCIQCSLVRCILFHTDLERNKPD